MMCTVKIKSVTAGGGHMGHMGEFLILLLRESQGHGSRHFNRQSSLSANLQSLYNGEE